MQMFLLQKYNYCLREKIIAGYFWRKDLLEGLAFHQWDQLTLGLKRKVFLWHQISLNWVLVQITNLHITFQKVSQFVSPPFPFPHPLSLLLLLKAEDETITYKGGTICVKSEKSFISFGIIRSEYH